AEGRRSGGDRRLHDAGEGGPDRIRGELVDVRLLVARALERALVRVGQGQVETQRLLCEVVAGAELARAFAPGRVDGRRFGGQRHQSFSIFTRNALNSGVLAFASPTNGVSARTPEFKAFLEYREALMTLAEIGRAHV